MVIVHSPALILKRSLDGDGKAEVIGIYGGDGVSVPPVLYIYDGFGTLKTRFEFLTGTTLALSS
jgi:hypothetical protein